MAPFAFDVSDHWKYFHFTQTIQYRSRTSEGGYGPTLTVLALKREDHKTLNMGQQMASMTTHTVIWNIWTNTMESPFIPKTGDRFVATNVNGAETWLVQEVDYCTPTFVSGTSKPTRYRLHCIQAGNNS